MSEKAGLLNSSSPLAAAARTCLFAAATIVGLPQIASAQQTVDMAQTTSIEEVVVTGSRLRNSGFEAPTPVTVASVADLAAAAPDSLADGLNSLPQFLGSTRDNQGGGSSGTTTGQNLLNLRNLGAGRNLVLLDGVRLPASNAEGSVNVNVVPQNLVKSVEIVTGGASAAYGSDAVAGVVNFILDTRLQGLRMEITGGVTTYGDSESGKASVAYGKSFADGRARLITSAEYFYQNGIKIGKSTGRDWFDVPYGRYVCPVSSCGFANFIGRDIVSSTGSTGGTITSLGGAQGTLGSVIRTGPLAGLQFGDNGSLLPFVLGTNVGTNYMVGGGSGIHLQNALSPTLKRGTVFAHAEYDITDNTMGFIEGLYASDHADSSGFQQQNINSQGQFTIFGDNAYLPSSIKTRLSPAQVGFNVPVFGLSRLNFELPSIHNESRMTLSRVRAGVKGKVFENWRYDVSFAYASSKQNEALRNIFNARHIFAAADAVLLPGTTTGQIVCRSNITGGNPGCVPMNLFGPNLITTASEQYILGDSEFWLTINQTLFNFNMSGDLGERLNFGAGPITLAFGGELRSESYNKEVDYDSAALVNFVGIQGVPANYNFPGRLGSYFAYNPQPSSGSYGVKEGYVEVGVPLLRDLPFAKSLDLNGAVRRADYKLSGGETTWKYGATWQVVDDFRLRATRSQDIRAPNVTELFNAGSQSNNPQTYPCAACANAFSRPTVVVVTGNINLKPERALTTTFGGIYQPSWLQGAQISVDYYNVKIKDFIGAASSAQDACSRGSTVDCARISINGVPITNINQVTNSTTGLRIVNPQVNAAQRKVSGIDIESGYARTLFAGNISVRALVNIGLHSITSNATIPEAIETLGNPRWTAVMSLRYDQERWSVFIQERVIDKVLNSSSLKDGVNVNCCNTVPRIASTDATGTFRFGANNEQELFLSVTNLFDQDPPVAPSNASNFVFQTDLGNYVSLGRRFTVGLRFKM